MPLPLVAVVGRPNVGKSSLVNRMAGVRAAIVHDEPGITRDRLYQEVEWNGRRLRVVDTGGLVFGDDSEFLPHIRQQAMAAMAEAHAVIFVVDGREGLTPADKELADWLRKQPLPVVVAVNKCESGQLGLAQAAVFWKLGLGEPIPCSALHGNGVAEVLEAVLPHLPGGEEAATEAEPIAVAIVGRPNVGKSSLLNRLVGSERAIVSPIAGTTRDAIDTLVEWEGQTYRLIDTAGIRRKSRVEYGVEFFSINRAFKAIRRSDVVLLVIDALEGVTEQDQRLAGRIEEEGRACIIVVNKWDAVEKDTYTINEYTREIRERLYFIDWAPLLFVSALTGQRTHKIFAEVNTVVAAHRKRIPTSVVNEVLQEALAWQSPPANRQGRQGKIYYGTQIAEQPPTFLLFVNDPDLFKENYRRYLEKHFRQNLDFAGTPLRFVWRGKSERRVAQEVRKLEGSLASP
ncbi:ribosome biogenesis GTPase Der [Synechococcus sp. WC10meta]|uniref:ribosome biogenesis GTPase Der n=1 Tax=Synechococcus sp. WC10meta TaxID=2964537 RepID=UPI0039C08681